jgi:TPR repeat protein
MVVEFGITCGFILPYPPSQMRAYLHVQVAYRDGVGGANHNMARAVGFFAKAAHQQHSQAAFVYG